MCFRKIFRLIDFWRRFINNDARWSIERASGAHLCEAITRVALILRTPWSDTIDPLFLNYRRVSKNVIAYRTHFVVSADIPYVLYNWPLIPAFYLPSFYQTFTTHRVQTQQWYSNDQSAIERDMKLRDDACMRWNNPPYIEQYKCTLNIGYHVDLPAIIGRQTH